MGLTPVEKQKHTETEVSPPATAESAPKQKERNNDAFQSHTPAITSTTPSIKSIAATPSFLQQDAKIDFQTQLQYAKNGHACLRSFLTSPEHLSNIRNDIVTYTNQREVQAWHQKLHVASPQTKKLPDSVIECQQMFEELDIPIPFLQHFNSWKFLNSVHELVTSPLMTSAASVFLHGEDSTKTVRLYQDSIFIKRYTDNETPWHIDAKMSPFDTSDMITFWIPLQYISRKSSGLHFVDKSHADIALPYWNGADDGDGSGEYGRLEERYGGEDSIKHYMPMALGDVTVHNGWTLHYASPGDEEEMEDRYALAVTYVDGRAEVRKDAIPSTASFYRGETKGDDEDNWSYKDWINEVQPRKQIDHELVPIVYPPSILREE